MIVILVLAYGAFTALNMGMTESESWRITSYDALEFDLEYKFQAGMPQVYLPGGEQSLSVVMGDAVMTACSEDSFCCDSCLTEEILSARAPIDI